MDIVSSCPGPPCLYETVQCSAITIPQTLKKLGVAGRDYESKNRRVSQLYPVMCEQEHYGCRH